MTPDEALELLCEAVPHSDKTEAACDALYALLRRDWAVRVLDAAAPNSRVIQFGAHCVIDVNGRYMPDVLCTSRDAARHAAALAVFPTLDAAARSELGECP